MTSRYDPSNVIGICQKFQMRIVFFSLKNLHENLLLMRSWSTL